MTKTCKECGTTKPLEEFYKCSRLRYGVTSECKECIKLRATLNYRENKDRYKQNARRWATENKERRKEIVRESAHKHSEKKKEYNKRWVRENPDKKRDSVRAWRKANPDKTQAYGQNRRSRKLEAEGSFTGEEFQALCDLYDNVCLCCEEEKSLTVDHVVPLSKGGSNSIENIQPLCGSCNSAKGVKNIDYRR